MKKIAWRFYDPDTDADQVLALHRAMEAKIGRKLDLPRLSERPVLVAIVGETDGKITHGMFLEAEVEVCVIGPNPLPTKEAGEAAKLLMPVLEYYKIRIARAFVPVSLLKLGKNGRDSAVGRILKAMQFVREKKQMSSWFRWIVTRDVS